MEKHKPVITAERKGEFLEITVKTAATHPNTPEHHIAWIEVWLEADEMKELARVEFNAHPQTEPFVKLRIRPTEGKIKAFLYCNIHGLWMSELTTTNGDASGPNEA